METKKILILGLLVSLFVGCTSYDYYYKGLVGYEQHEDLEESYETQTICIGGREAIISFEQVTLSKIVASETGEERYSLSWKYASRTWRVLDEIIISIDDEVVYKGTDTNAFKSLSGGHVRGLITIDVPKEVIESMQTAESIKMQAYSEVIDINMKYINKFFRRVY